MCFFFFKFLFSFSVVLSFFFMSYLIASIFRDPMLNCFWTERCSFYFAVTPLDHAMLGTRLGKSCQLSLFYYFLKFQSIKSSDTNIFGHFNFRTESFFHLLSLSLGHVPSTVEPEIESLTSTLGSQQLVRRADRPRGCSRQ